MRIVAVPVADIVPVSRILARNPFAVEVKGILSVPSVFKDRIHVPIVLESPALLPVLIPGITTRTGEVRMEVETLIGRADRKAKVDIGLGSISKSQRAI